MNLKIYKDFSFSWQLLIVLLTGILLIVGQESNAQVNPINENDAFIENEQNTIDIVQKIRFLV